MAESERVPAPYATAVVQASLAAVVAVGGLAAGIDWRWLIVVLLSFGLVSAVAPIRAVMELGRRRRAADEWLLWGAVAHPSSPLLSARAAELTSRKTRSTLAQSLRRVRRDVAEDTVSPLVRLNRRSIRRNLGLVDALQERLDDDSRPVDPRGMLLVQRLITVPRSPLYARDADDELARALGEALAALDLVPVAAAA
jgi:hypothetical protein